MIDRQELIEPFRRQSPVGAKIRRHRDELENDHQQAWADIWKEMDVVIEGDPGRRDRGNTVQHLSTMRSIYRSR